jgi:hypothetical protein
MPLTAGPCAAVTAILTHNVEKLFAPRGQRHLSLQKSEAFLN